jgi:hypothetical protein
MPDNTSNDYPRTIPVDPTIHVETFAAHQTLTWKAGSRSQFIEAIRGLDAVSSTSSVVVDDTTLAGRQHRPLSEIDRGSDTATYLRVEPDAPWTLSWEQRTQPIVSVSGTPSEPLCRRVHRRTTDCSEWSSEATATLHRLVTDKPP